MAIKHQSKTENKSKDKQQIDSKIVAYKLLDILYADGYINFATYQKIQAQEKEYLAMAIDELG